MPDRGGCQSFGVFVLCLSIGMPAPIVTWAKDQNPIKPRKWDRRIKVDHDFTTDMQILEIHKATPTDAGIYSILAKNRKGTAEKQVSVYVGEHSSEFHVEHTLEEQKERHHDTPTVAPPSGAVGLVMKKYTVDLGEGDEDVHIDFYDDDDEDLSLTKPASSTLTEPFHISGVGQPAETPCVEAVKRGVEPHEMDGSPSLVIRPEPVAVDVGETINLSCKVKGQILHGNHVI